MKRNIIVVLLALAGCLAASPRAGAQTLQCVTPEQKIVCQEELKKVEAESAAAQRQLQSAQNQSASLSRDIAVLDAKIKAAQLDIRAKNLLIASLGEDISDKQKHIASLEASISRGKETLADILRKTNELDQTTLSEMVLSQKSVSGFFRDLDTFQSVQGGLASTFAELRQDQTETAEAKDALEKRKNATLDARHAIEVQQANIKADQNEQKRLLGISKGNEKAYASVVGEKEARAAQIRSALFELSGTKAIPFGDALSIANTVYNKTGVPQAFLLAILKQETNIGGNVGTCYLINTSDGSGLNARTNAAIRGVMKPGRDIEPFISITSSLGLDYKKMPVSCPQSIGYGGGMGPAQFIASTWMLIKDRIAAAVGKSNPNPWTPLDAFMASGIYLSDLGAGSSSYSAQKNAACKYYSGRPCGYVPGATAYGNSVMALADSIQRNQINPLLGL
jgi:peptidoglycan hydrolase CwlO-like protein